MNFKYCENCGTKNEDDSKFCISCGEKLEEVKEEQKDKKEEKEDIVEQVKNKRKEFIEHKYDAKPSDTTGVRINGKEIKVDTSPSTTPTSTNNSKTGLIIAIVAISILVLGALSIATVFILKDFVIGERKPIVSTRDNKKDNTIIKKDDKKVNIDDWEINYSVPNELEKTSDSSTLKMYKYQKDGIMCSMYVWKLTYVTEGDTEESLITKYSQVYPKEKINVPTKEINGKEWKYIEQKDTWNKYEYGRLSKDKKSFYSIRTIDYDPEEGKCKELFDEVINSISYK